MKLRNKEVEDLIFKSYLDEIMQKKKFWKELMIMRLLNKENISKN